MDLNPDPNKSTSNLVTHAPIFSQNKPLQEEVRYAGPTGGNVNIYSSSQASYCIWAIKTITRLANLSKVNLG